MTTALLLAAALWAAPVQKATLEGCVRQAACWNLVRASFAEIFPAMKTEAEGSEPERFFPGVVVFSGADPGTGHLLQLRKIRRGGGMGAETKAERDELEARLVAAALLSSLPREDGIVPLFDEKTWEPTPAGKKMLKRLEAAKPGVWSTVYGWVWGGRKKDAVTLERIEIKGKAPSR